jgi:hypothetical protein
VKEGGYKMNKRVLTLLLLMCLTGCNTEIPERNFTDIMRDTIPEKVKPVYDSVVEKGGAAVIPAGRNAADTVSGWVYLVIGSLVLITVTFLLSKIATHFWNDTIKGAGGYIAKRSSKEKGLHITVHHNKRLPKHKRVEIVQFRSYNMKVNKSGLLVEGSIIVDQCNLKKAILGENWKSIEPTERAGLYRVHFQENLAFSYNIKGLENATTTEQTLEEQDKMLDDAELRDHK